MSDQQGKKKHKLLNIRLLFIMVSMAEIMGTLVVAGLLSWLSKMIFNRVFEIPDYIWLIAFSVIIGVTVSIVINNILLRPVVKLSKAMKQVATGDFGIRLKSDSPILEINDSYESFNLMVRELEATETLQTDFVANVSHEFKTPINAIEGYATLLQSGEDVQQQAYVERILLNTRRLSTLVGNILLLAKVNNHAIPAAQNSFLVDEQIRQCILLLEPQWTAKNTDFDVDLDEVTWNGPENLMHHVWSNLIGNAIKFGPEHGMIHLRLKQTDGRFVFTVEDEGHGIPDEEKQRVFHKFYQGDSSHKQEGNGLGLALAKQIIDSCGGSIRVEDSETGGCRFVVELPDSHV
ncbi:MAG: HAMP domain-containing sensor histidine kinase [Clostridiales bacterium]|nr:HAMP domain-containing sensor histidine kinase [Clostridiales bacterium]